MTAITLPTVSTDTTTDTSTRRPVLRATAGAAAVATVATTAFAAVCRAADVPFRIDGEPIPVSGFAVLTAVGVVVGGLLLAAFNRWSSHAHRRFVHLAVVLTALSCIPSLTAPPDTASRLGLAAAHVVAALVAVPVLARRARS